ncbi:hypothetical protein AQUSIP_19800 [Aquicella siphonis]|uniref:2-oxoadipate dioxygenase/decarboxylase n=1 Tax=Aquicella siphonis TaxID=254247 RepID=A0A5E4PK85_9COXI|nr:DUF1338 family protein [Aquicella siphonis]VVC76656.1 hypothetical protein AQUSIP_19800 [Aquicella siphonis]
MLHQLRKKIVQTLWESYRTASPDMRLIDAALKPKGIDQPPLDHFAVIDLPGPHTGIPILKEIFAATGYVSQGQGYLPDKQNDFHWLAESGCQEQRALDVLPQVVVADFRLDEMPADIRVIIEQYSSQAAPAPLDQIRRLSRQAASGDLSAVSSCADLVLNYLTGRSWTFPTIREFHMVREFNELLAWVLVFGRRPNHFTLSVHLMSVFPDLAEFHRFIHEEVSLPLNHEGGVMKGGRTSGIAQGSTTGLARTIRLADGEVSIPAGFVEFVWRYPVSSGRAPVLWGDYFTGFIAQHADRVIESLYLLPDHA